MAAQDLTYFKQFYYALHPSLTAFAVYYLKSEPDAKEVVNDVFMKLWDQRERIGPFDKDAANRLRSYAFQATKNSCLNYLRAQKKTFMQIEDHDMPENATPDTVLADKVNQELLKNWVDQLPPKCKQVFLMSRIDGLSNKEISELMDVSIKTVENQMTKALNFFRKKLKNE